MKTFFHGHSYTANPLACAVALESLKIFEEEAVLSRVQRLEEQLRRRLEPLKAFPQVGDVRVIGGVGILELVRDKDSGSAHGYLNTIGPMLTAEFLRRGLLLRPLGNVLYFMPPYVITESETDWAIDQIIDVLKNLE